MLEVGQAVPCRKYQLAFVPDHHGAAWNLLFLQVVVQKVVDAIHSLGSGNQREEGREKQRQRDPFHFTSTTATSVVRRENLSEPPHFVKGVVERRGRGANDVGFAKIAFHSRSFELFVQLLRMFVGQDRELTAARVGITRRADREAV